MDSPIRMRGRYLAAGLSVAAFVALMPLAGLRLLAQAPLPQPPAAPKFTPPKATYTPPKTPWGDPDIQGVYDYESMIPMQRPAELKDKAVFTDAELIEWAKGHTPNQDQCGYGTKVNEKCSVRQLDNVGDYNEFWDTRKIVKTTGPRSSSIRPTATFRP